MEWLKGMRNVMEATYEDFGVEVFVLPLIAQFMVKMNVVVALMKGRSPANLIAHTQPLVVITEFVVMELFTDSRNVMMALPTAISNQMPVGQIAHVPNVGIMS